MGTGNFNSIVSNWNGLSGSVAYLSDWTFSHLGGIKMDKNYETLLHIKENQLIKAFEKNNMSCMVVKNKEELHHYLKNILIAQKKVAVGGSVTLTKLGVLDLIQESDVQFIDRYEEGLSDEQVYERLREGLLSDIFITSTNALTMDGCLYNVDGRGNRVSAMIFGPREVYVIAGLNKIFNNEQEAMTHIREYSAPANALRLNKKTPCTKLGSCQDCFSEGRICSSYVKLGYQGQKNRIHIIIIEENIGY